MLVQNLAGDALGARVRQVTDASDDFWHERAHDAGVPQPLVEAHGKGQHLLCRGSGAGAGRCWCMGVSARQFVGIVGGVGIW